MVTVRDVIWASGFMEGEASFGFYNATPIIQVRQCNWYCLERLVEIFGGKIRSEKTSAIGRKPIFAWKVWSSKAISIMMTVYPLMSPVRQETIASVIAGWKKLSGTCGETHPNVHVSDAQALVALRRVLKGESVVIVARESGIPRATLHNLVAGRARSYLLRQLESEGLSAAWLFPAGHMTRKHLKDEVILSAMRRVRDGETLSKVAASIGVKHSVMSHWMDGTNRPEFLQQLLDELPLSQWCYTRRKPSGIASDDDLLMAILRVQSGEGITRAAKHVGVNRNTLSCCMRGLTRPYLLARLREEAPVTVKEE